MVTSGTLGGIPLTVTSGVVKQAVADGTVVGEISDVGGALILHRAGSGLAMGPLDDTTPSLGEDVLGCSSGPAMTTTLQAGDRMAFAPPNAFLLAVEVVDTTVGPCIQSRHRG